MKRSLPIVIALAISAAGVRLIPLQWLHPLNWDEVEFFRATDWIARGRVPYRDFWEHHTPLTWFILAPFTALTNSPGVDAIIAMRWAQVPVWIATFWLTNLWMRGAGIERFARWSAMALALSSSMFMIPAVEYRVDSLACMLFMAALVFAQRSRYFASGVAFCLAGWANLRLGPLLVMTLLLLWYVRRRDSNAKRMAIAGAATFTAGLLYFVATRSFAAFYEQVWVQNYVGEKLATAIVGGFLHRLIVPFGVRLMGSERFFDLAGVDIGGVCVIVAGFAGLLLALRNWRAPNDLFVLAVVQVVSLAFLVRMHFVYNYHFEIVVIVMIPLVAIAIERIPRRSIIVAVIALAWCVNAFASIFRGKELDLAYQDLIMREVHSRTRPDERVWSGQAWALRREPAYEYWFLPDMVQQLVRRRLVRPYSLRRAVNDPPAAIVFDHYALVWMATVERDLAPYFVRHYFPVWRNLWIPAMNGALRPGARIEWTVPRDGDYRVFASPELARHGWFRAPLTYATYNAVDAARLTIKLPAPAPHRELDWFIDRKPAMLGPVVTLRKGQRIGVVSRSREPIAVLLLAGKDAVVFRQPPAGATLEGEMPRVTHVPRIGLRIQP
jgi:hypothetical protein